MMSAAAPNGNAMKPSEWEINWSNSLSVGVPEIDEEHQQFVARVNELNRAIVEGKDKSTVERLLDLMLMEATHHFWHEQQLLAQWKYPQRAAHAAKHAQLTAQFDRVMKEFEQADVSFTWALKGLHIKQLLVDHLLHEDMKYRDFLRRKKHPGQRAGHENARKRVHATV
jgi:hemerythrin-like metal-binding protein